MFVFSFLSVLGCIGAAAWLFLIEPKQEKPGILTASVEIGAPIIIESDADPVPTELENAAGAVVAPIATETVPEPTPELTEEPAPTAETTPEKATEPAKSNEPVQSEETADVAPKVPAPEIAEVVEPKPEELLAEETLAAASETEAETEPAPVAAKEEFPAAPQVTEEVAALEEAVDPLPPALEPTKDLEAAPPVSIVEEPVAPAETLDTRAEETAPVMAAVEEEATDPPAVSVQPDPIETVVAAAPEILQPEETPEIAETVATASETEAKPPVTEPVSETAEVDQEPEIPVISETLPSASEEHEETAPTEVVLSEEQPELEETAPVVIEPSDTASELKEETAPLETALVIPPAPVEPEVIRADPEPEQISTAVAVAPAPLLWQTHARAFEDPLDRPRIALIIGEMGVSSIRTAAAIDGLPGSVTLAFNPYGRNLQSWITKAREAGHEVLLQLPMEPVGYPRIDPGPQALLTSLDAAANLERLEWALGRMEGYVGITNQMGSRFTASKEHIRPVLEAVKEKGLLYLDSRSASNSVGAQVASELSLPVALNNRFLDHKADGDIIDARLAELEEIALKTGSAVGVAYPYSLTLEHISRWADGLADKNIVLAPVSALVNRQDIK